MITVALILLDRNSASIVWENLDDLCVEGIRNSEDRVIYQVL